jgi:cell division protein FtsL
VKRLSFPAIWVLALAASVSAMLVHLAIRGRVLAAGYDLGRAYAEQEQMKEVRRVLELERASERSPERIRTVAKALRSMDPPAPEQVVIVGSGRVHAQARAGAADGERR